MCDRVDIGPYAIAEQSYEDIATLRSWFIRTKGREESRIPVDIDYL
jgi:hypothetical protein